MGEPRVVGARISRLNICKLLLSQKEFKLNTSKENELQVGDEIAAGNAGWTFGGEVAKTFDSHVSKSVPFYEEGHSLICGVSDFFVKDNSIVYEIGCSTGMLSKRLASHNISKNARFIGIDCESAMVEQARSSSSMNNLEFEQADILEYEFEKSDFITSYYTIQFIHPSLRQALINRIFENLNWGGGFLFFEKVRACDARFQDMMTALYTDFKLEQGYSAGEIVGKTKSLKGVLEPFSTQGNLDMLKRAGFEDVTSVMKYVSFEGFLAIK